MAKAELANLEPLDELFAKLELEMRGELLRSIAADAARPLVRAIKTQVPKPGYPGDKPELTPLRETIDFAVREYPRAIVAMVGANRRKGGQHGTPVDQGHRIVVGGTTKAVKSERTRRSKSAGRTGQGRVVGQVEGLFYMRSAFAAARASIQAATIRGFRKVFGRQVNKALSRSR